MKVTKKVTADGSWAKANKDILDGDRIKLLDAGKIVEGDYGPRTVFKILTTTKKEFNFSMNQTSMNNLIDGWGPDTSAWVDKVAKVFVVRQMVGDGLKNVVYIAPEGWTLDNDGKFVNPDENPDNKRNDPEEIPF